jgi:glycosyltransferase involved in cell wall biosynthesis
MTIFFYHTLPVREAYNEWIDHKHPGQLLYGLTHFDHFGVDCIFHNYKKQSSRLRMMLRNFKEIVFCQEKFDILYATSFRGLELIIFMRALGLYRKPLAIWHHTAVVSSPNKIKNLISRFFYKGFDQVFFFNTSLIERSLKTGKVKENQVHLIHWGADLKYYDRLLKEVKEVKDAFISTGKENRDFPTLIKAFEASEAVIDLYVPKINGKKDYQEELSEFSNLPENIHLNFVSGSIADELARKVAASSCVVVCCYDFPYTVGLTTLVEAMALGKPVLCSANPFWEMNIAKEGAGIVIPFGDIQAWKEAIKYITEHKKEADEMGKKGRALAEKKYNLELFTQEIVEILKKI